MRLDLFTNTGFDRGASRVVEFLWLMSSGLMIASWVPGSRWRCALLRIFGAQVGVGVVLKPNVRVKFPWRLSIGDYVWIGESVWIDNLDRVSIGSHSCISQGVYICTGSHDWRDISFSLLTKPVVIEDNCWIGAFARIAPGTIMEKGAVLMMGAMGRGRLTGEMVHSGVANAPPRKRGRVREPEIG